MSNISVPPDVIVHRDLADVTDPHPRQRLDLYLPSHDAPLPLIVWIHGGAFCWGSSRARFGTPKNWAYTRRSMMRDIRFHR